ncbi:hypothetical protein, partial [Aeromonas caviae]|uniref:hypothetical protein n=1 Tax=Aeromonas caviae TaxID=648 RepID=UPI001FBBC06A
YDARRQQGDGGGVFGDSQFTSTLSVNFHFPKIPRRTKKIAESYNKSHGLWSFSIQKRANDFLSGFSCPLVEYAPNFTLHFFI